MFDNAQDGFNDAREVEMRTVGLYGHGICPAYDMRGADTVVEHYGDLTVANVRRLFSEPIVPEMELELELEKETRWTKLAEYYDHDPDWGPPPPSETAAAAESDPS